MRLWLLLAGCSGFSSTMQAPPSSCPLHHAIDYFYCDGFEDGLDARYSTVAYNGDAKLDGIHVYRGGQALHLHAGEGSGDAGGTIGPSLTASSTDLINIDSDEVDLRVFLYAVGPPVSGSLRLITLSDMQVELADGDLNLSGLEPTHTRMPMDRWVCLEMQLVASGNVWNGSIRVDSGDPVTEGFQIGDLANGFSLQLQHDDPTRAVDLWFDELVVDHQPIGCGS